MTAPHDLPLVSTVAVGLSLAFILGLIASKLRLPPLVGYLLAGIIIGPNSPGFIADTAIAEQLSEIGVVLLLFGVGLHFSIKDFMEVRRIASAGAITTILIITAIGIGVAALWGWSMSTGIIFGLALSVASTVVVLRTLEEHHLLNSIAGKISIGWLIVEDIAMVLALIMIPALAVQDVVEGETVNLGLQIVIALAKAAVFAIIMIVVGRRVLPWILTAVSRTGSRELFTLAVFAMAMGIAFGAAILFGVSFALGAFFAGMMIRESDLNHEVADRALPFQDAFAVLFFVAIGMLFDPAILWMEPVKVFVTAFIIVVGKAVVGFAIMRLFRYPVRKSLLVAACLAQIGEFSFILLALGASAGLLSEEAKDLILSGALISIAVNPVIFLFCHRYTLKAGPVASENEDDLAHLAEEETNILKDLVILVGYSKVGSLVAKSLDTAHIDLVIVDNNRETVEVLRYKGYHAIAGDGGDAITLEDALITKASAVLIAVSDPFEARRIVEATHKLKPDAKIIVHSHNHDETVFFESQKVDLAVNGTDEVARRMVWALEQLRTPVLADPVV